MEEPLIRYTYVHNCVYPKGERMIVRRRDGGRCGSADVCENHFATRITAQRSEVGIVERRLDRLVECGMETGPCCSGRGAFGREGG